MQSLLTEEMADEKTLRRIEAIEKDGERLDERFDKVETSFGKIRDYVQVDIGQRLSKSEGQITMLMWMVGIALPAYIGLFIAGGVQLYLLNGRVSGIESDVRKIGSTVDAIHLKQISSVTITPESAMQVKQIVETAKLDNLKIDPAVIAETGKTIVASSESNPEAWPAVAALLEYKSFLNASSLALSIKDAKPNPLSHSTYLESRAPGYQSPALSVSGLVPEVQSARLGPIGSDLNSTLTISNQFIIAQGGGIVLDGMNIRNVVFRNVHIVYRGGPINLDSVYFINCTFEIVRQPNSINFASAFLESSSGTTFSPTIPS